MLQVKDHFYSLMLLVQRVAGICLHCFWLFVVDNQHFQHIQHIVELKQLLSY